MAEKDIAEKNLEALNDVFADIVNVLLFNGKRLIQEDELESDKANTMFKADGKLHEQERDVSKFWKKGKIRISLLGFENQTKQDYKMPLRVISYDGASYKTQLLDSKQSLYYPVVTMVLYFGTNNRWTASKNLKNILKIPDELEPFVSDYKINVFEIAWLSDATINMFKSDFKLVAKYFQTKRLKTEYKGSTDIIKHVDETFKMLSTLSGDDIFERVYNEDNLKEKGGVTMCDVVERIINKGITQGRAEGRIEAREELIIKMIESKAGSIEQIASWLQIPVEEIQKISKKVPVIN